MKKLLIVIAAVIGLSGCTDADNATRILDDNGYTNIQITGYNWFGCSEDDFQHTGFTATGPTGKTISGTVCSGIFFKNSTVRFQ